MIDTPAREQAFWTHGYHVVEIRRCDVPDHVRVTLRQEEPKASVSVAARVGPLLERILTAATGGQAPDEGLAFNSDDQPEAVRVFDVHRDIVIGVYPSTVCEPGCPGCVAFVFEQYAADGSFSQFGQVLPIDRLVELLHVNTNTDLWEM